MGESATSQSSATKRGSKARTAPAIARKKKSSSTKATGKKASPSSRKAKGGKATRASASSTSKAAGKAANKATGKASGKPGGKKKTTTKGTARRAAAESARQPVSLSPRERKRVDTILEILKNHWAEAVCELDHDDAYQLLVATILSAQSTDKRINQVTPALFARYPDAPALANADIDELEELIRSTGFFRMKAKHLLGMARAVTERHGGDIPRTMRALTALPGVARKTANVVLGTAFAITSGIVVDTHVQRVSGRLGLSDGNKAERIERDLMEIVPKHTWIEFGHQMVWHGRRICHARKPACDRCPLLPLCPSAEVSSASSTSRGRSS